MKPIIEKIAAYFARHRRLQNVLVVVGCLCLMTLVGRVFFLHDLDISIIIMLYLLTVLFISRFTTGYLSGIVASVLAVFLFNYFFTEPYFSLAAYDSKYPLIFLIMLAVSLLTSATTVRIRRSAEERIRLARLQEKTQQDFEAERLRSTILRSLSHDLRTPLTSISGAASLLAEDSREMTDDERRRLLSDIYAESIWLNRFVENMLSMTRIDDHLLKLQTTSELVEELVGEAVNLARRRIAGLHVEVAIPDEPVLVDVDSSLIEEVLLNLIENAAVHTPLGERIEVRVRLEGGSAVFSVRDYGPGIRPDEFGRLFERYFVGTEPRYDSRRGQGIGLSICRTIVQAHGGGITAENHPEGGAVFEFSLPGRKEGA